MIRMQIYLPKQLYEDVKLRASVAGKPTAEVIRDFVYRGIESRDNSRAKSRGILELADLGITGGPKDLALHLDDYMYGGK